VRAEDFEVTARLALKRYSANVVPKFHLLQRRHDGSQSAQFQDKQKAVSHRIQEETVETFITHPAVKALSAFLLLEEDPINGKRNKASIKKIGIMMEELFVNIKEKQKLSEDELNSLKKVIFNRVGVGIKNVRLISCLPPFLFMPTYYLLSPQQLPNVREFAATFYQKVVRQRYFVK
jgi:hypothetical protein